MQEGIRFLAELKIEPARLLAERLLEGLLHCKRFELYLDQDRILSGEEKERYLAFLKQRVGGVPSQYILGYSEFMDFTVRVNRSVLIPRPETEFLVEKVVEAFASGGEVRAPVSLLDMGTGSGNIAVSLASYLPQASVWAVDISDEALEVARQNAAWNEVGHRIRFSKSDLFKGVPSGLCFDLVVSNPPYLSDQEMKEIPPEVSLEPRIALHGGREGTEFILRLVREAPHYLRQGGMLFFEMGACQGQRIRDIFTASEWQSFKIFKDYNGLDRVAMAVKR